MSQQSIQVRLPADLHTALKKRAATKGDSLNTTIVRALTYAMTAAAGQTMTFTETKTTTVQVGP